MKIIDDITDFIFVAGRPQKSDVIFLPGSASPELPEAGAKLYREGFANFVLPSGKTSYNSAGLPCRPRGGRYRAEYATECAFYTDVLLKNGVPQEAVIPEDRSRFTRENAFFSRRTADAKGLVVRKALICCKSFHARRCLMFYQLAFPETEIVVCPVDCFGITRENWFKQELGVRRVLGELERCGGQFKEDFKQYLGLHG